MNLNSRKHGSKCLNGMISEFYESDLTKCKRGEISMKHKGKDQIPVEKRGFLGAKKNIMDLVSRFFRKFNFNHRILGS